MRRLLVKLAKLFKFLVLLINNQLHYLFGDSVNEFYVVYLKRLHANSTGNVDIIIRVQIM